MATIRRDSIQLRFTAKDDTRQGFAGLRRSVDTTLRSARRLQTTLTSIGSAGLVRSLRLASSATSALGIGGAGAVGTLTALGVVGANTADNIKKLSDATGIASEELGRLQFAFSQTSELSDQAINSSIQRFTTRLSQAAEGRGAAANSIRELGLSASELERAGADEALLQISDAIRNVKSEADQLRLVDTLFGREGRGLVNTLRRGSDEIRALGDQADALGLTFSSSKLSLPESAIDSFSRLKDVVSAAGVSLAVELSPAFIDIVQQFEDWVVANGGIQQVVTDTVVTIKDLAAQVGVFVGGAVESFRSLGERVDEIRLKWLRLNKALNIGIGGNREYEEQLGREIALIEARIEARERDAALPPPAAPVNPESLSDNPTISRLVDRSENEEADTRQRVEAQRRAERERQIAEAESRRQDAAAQTLARQRENEARVLEQQKAEAQVRLGNLRALNDEEFRINKEAQERIAALNADAGTVGLGEEDLSDLRLIIYEERNRQLREFNDRQKEERQRAIDERNRELEQEREEYTRNAEERQSALDLGGLANFQIDSNVNQTGLRAQLEAVRQAFADEAVEINSTLTLSEPEKQQTLAEARRFKEQLEGELEATARVNANFDGLQTVAGGAASFNSILSSVSEAQASQEEAVLRQRADTIKQVQDDLNAAIASGNDAEVGLLQNKLNSLNSLQQKEEAAARQRFEKNKKREVSFGRIAALATGIQVFRETPGLLPIKLLAAAAATAAGLASVEKLNQSQYSGGGSTSGFSGGGGSSGGSGSVGNVSNLAVTDRTQQGTSAARGGTFIFNAQGRDRFDIEEIREFVEVYNESSAGGGPTLAVI